MGEYQQLRPGSLSTSIGVAASSEKQEESHVLPLCLSTFFVLTVIFNQIQVVTDLMDPRERYVTCQTVLFLGFALLYWIVSVECVMLRSKGYIQFYVKVSKLVRVMFLIVSYATCLICALYAYYLDWPAVPEFFNKDTLMRALVTVEHMFIFGCVAAYIYFRFAHLSRLHSPLESKPGVQQLETQIQALTDEINTLRQQLAQPRESESSLSPEATVAKAETRALKSEADRLKQAHADYVETAQRAQDLLRKEHAEATELIAEQKRKIRQLTKDNEQLTILVEVHKESNANVQNMIDSLTGHAGFQFSPTS